MDKNAAYPPAIEELKSEKVLDKKSEIRQVKYLNNLVEQDHRGVKKITNAALGYIVISNNNGTLFRLNPSHSNK